MQLRTIALLIVIGLGFVLFGRVISTYFDRFGIEAELETIAVRGCVEDWSASSIKQRVLEKLFDTGFKSSREDVLLERRPQVWTKPCESLSIQVSYRRDLVLLGQQFQVVFHSSASNHIASPLSSSKAIRSIVEH